MDIAANFLRARDVLFLSCLLLASQVQAADFCSDIMPAAIQSHSPDGYILMEYMTRVYGSGSTLVARDVRHTHSWQDQVGLCDGVKCQASGTNTVKSTVSFLTGTEVPQLFEAGNATAGNRSNEGYRQPTLSLPANDYGTISVGQESTIRFTTVDAVYKTRTIKTSYKGTLELSPGDYWINGNLDLTSQDSIVRLINSSNTSQKVRLFVSGNITAGQIHLQGFAQGQIALYVWGNASFGNDFILPGEIHARGTVGFGMRPRVSGGIYSNNFSTGNEALIRYTRTNRDHYMGTLQPAFNSVFELSPGNYWINGNFVVDVSAIIRKINGPGKVRIFVNGNINLQHASSFEGFAAGELLLYATGNINIASQKDLPAYLYANGDVKISFSGNSRFLGNIVGHNVTIGQGSIVEYQIPNDLEPFCSTTPVINSVNYHLIYPPEALTCNEIPVTLEARGSNGELLTSASTVSLSPANMWINSANHTFTGSTIAYLRRQPGSYILGINNPSPASSSISCSTTDCTIRLHDSGFILDVPHLVAADPSNAEIRAVKTDDATQRCIPGFAGGNRTILFSSSYQNPASGTLFPSIEGQSVSNTAQPIPLTFDNNATARFELQYDDVGALTLNASYTGSGDEQGLQMIGSSNFITRPHTLAVTEAFTEDTPNPGTTGAQDSIGFIAAGEDFSVTITASNKNGQPTPNFGKEIPRQLVETHFGSLVYPSGGSNGNLIAGTVNTTLVANNGQQQVDNVSWDEVGSIKLTANLAGNSYMNTGDVIAKPESNVIGRFYPHHFVVTTSEVKNSCQQFSYMSHNNLTINYQLQARNKNTQAPLFNYHTDIYSDTAQIGILAYDTDTATELDHSRFSVNSTKWQHGEYTITQTDAAFKRDNLPDGPFYNLQPGVSIIIEKDNRQFRSVDLGNNGVKLDRTLDMRFGRMVLQNAYGPEDENLPLELNTEYWNGSRFVLNTDDNCSELLAAKLNPILFTPEESVIVAAQITASGNSSQPTLVNGSSVINKRSGIWLNAPNQRGEGTATYQVPEWLQYDWSGTAPSNDENPVAEFIFGHYRGNPRQIFWREKF